MSNEGTEDGKLSRKEFAKKVRREAYARAKERRATDPKQLALKAALKERRREAYRAVQERRQASSVVDKQARKEALRERQEAARARRHETLGKRVRAATAPAESE